MSGPSITPGINEYQYCDKHLKKSSRRRNMFVGNVCVGVRVCVCACVCMHVHTYIYIHTYTYTHTYVCTYTWFQKKKNEQYVDEPPSNNPLFSLFFFLFLCLPQLVSGVIEGRLIDKKYVDEASSNNPRHQLWWTHWEPTPRSSSKRKTTTKPKQKQNKIK